MDMPVTFLEGCFCLNCKSNNMHLHVRELDVIELDQRGNLTNPLSNNIVRRLKCCNCGAIFGVSGPQFGPIEAEDSIKRRYNDIIEQYTLDKNISNKIGRAHV